MTQKPTPCYFDTCCFCISLRTGCFLMAYSQLFLITIGLFTSAYFANMAITEANAKFQYIPSIWFLLGGVFFFFMGLTLIFDIIVIIGLHKKKPGLVKAFVIYNIVLMVIFAGLIVAAIVSSRSSAPVLMTRVFQLLGSIYYLLVYRNYYIQMKEGSDQTINSQG